MGHKNKGDHQKFKKFLILVSHFIYFLIFNNYIKYSFDLQITDANPSKEIFYLRLLSTKSGAFWKNCPTHATIKETVINRDLQ